jgi:hypothetical protein
MIAERVWSITGSGRDLGMHVVRAEPSHIHLPRRRRVVRPDDQATSAPGGASFGDDEQGGPAQHAPDDA